MASKSVDSKKDEIPPGKGLIQIAEEEGVILSYDELTDEQIKKWLDELDAPPPGMKEIRSSCKIN